MSDHLSEQLLEAYRGRRLPAADLLAADEHLWDCEFCRLKLAQPRAAERAGETLRDWLDPLGAIHLTVETIDDYVEDRLRGVEVAAAEAHLRQCNRCRREVEDLRAFVAEMAAYPKKMFAPSASEAAPRKAGLESVLSSLLRFNWQMAAVAALLLLTLGAFFFLRTRLGKSQDDVAGGGSPTPGPVVSPSVNPSPTSMPPPDAPAEVLIALNDGGREVTLDRSGRLSGLPSLPLELQAQIVASLRAGRAPLPEDLSALTDPSKDVRGGTPEEKNSFQAVGPAGVVVRSDRPQFRWQPCEGANSYVVDVYDPMKTFERVASSEPLERLDWIPIKGLERGRVYTWQVRAMKDGQEIKKTDSASFQVLEQKTANQISLVERAQPRSRLALGLLYARAGMLEEAEREFKLLAADNPQAPAIRKLLRSIEAARQKSR